MPLSRNDDSWRILLKVLDPHPDADDVQNLISFSLFTDATVVNFHKDSISSFHMEFANRQTEKARQTDSGVARICCEERQRLKLCHGALTVNLGVGCTSCSMTNSFVTNTVLIKRAVSCWHLHQLISKTTQYLDSWLSDLEVKGGTCPSAP